MNITSIVKKALKYPQHDFKNTVIMAVFLIIASIFIGVGTYVTVPKLESAVSPADLGIYVILIIAFIIMHLFVQGYIYRVYKGADVLPEFNNFKEMLVQGIKVIAVTIAYNILPFIVFFLGFYVDYAGIFHGGMWIALIGMILVAIVNLFVRPFAIANMVSKDSIKEAFDINLIIDKIVYVGILPYIGALVLVGIIRLVIVIAFSVLMGIAVSLFMAPILGTVVLALFGILGFIITAYLELFTNKTYQLLFVKESI